MNDIKKTKTSKKRMDSMELPKNQKIISWEAPEFIHYERSTKWYIAFFVIGAGFAVLFFWLQNYLFFSAIILAIIVIFIVSRQTPKKRLFKLSKDGFEVNEKKYPLDEFKSYFITYTDNVASLHMEKAYKLSMPISALLVNVNIDEIEKFINRYLPENQKATTPTSDLMSKWFKF